MLIFVHWIFIQFTISIFRQSVLCGKLVIIVLCCLNVEIHSECGNHFNHDKTKAECKMYHKKLTYHGDTASMNRNWAIVRDMTEVHSNPLGGSKTANATSLIARVWSFAVGSTFFCSNSSHIYVVALAFSILGLVLEEVKHRVTQTCGYKQPLPAV